MYDVIVVGARVAGSATARLLAQRGHRVLVVDRAMFPSDTVSTHCIDPVGVQVLRNWGLWDAVLGTGTPRVERFVLTVGGNELPADAPPPGIAAPRRTVLDKLLVDEARAAGAEVREGVKVTALLRDEDGSVCGIAAVDGDGKEFTERARLVIGADGSHSFVAREVGADTYDARQGRGSGYYAYYSGTGLEAVELAFKPGYFAGVFPTNDGETCVFGGEVDEGFADRAEDRDVALVGCVRQASARLGDVLAASTRTSKFVKWRALPGFFRTPYGSGWALVGDAGFHIDPVTGRGIGHAFRDADLLARAADRWLGDGDAAAFAEYHSTRDAMSKAMYDLTQDIADATWTNDELMGHFMNLLVATVELMGQVATWDGQVESSTTAAGSAVTS